MHLAHYAYSYQSEARSPKVNFFLPGSNGSVPAKVTGFGAIFTDVDEPNGSGPWREAWQPPRQYRDRVLQRRRQTDLQQLRSSSPGDGNFSFLGIIFDDARIARVRITTGNVALGPDDGRKHAVVAMDDFFYGEPKPLFP